MSDLLNPNKIVVFTGYELSQSCGVLDHRNPQSLGVSRSQGNPFSSYAWERTPAQVIATFNAFKQSTLSAEPNDVHRMIAKLEAQYDVTVLTQNVDNLHERAGSTDVRHLHGDVLTARSPEQDNLLINIGNEFLIVDQHSSLQLRPNIVSYGERTYWHPEAKQLIQSASLILAVGVSFDILPAIHLLRLGSPLSERHFVSERDQKRLISGYKIHKESGLDAVPRLVGSWLD